MLIRSSLVMLVLSLGSLGNTAPDDPPAKAPATTPEKNPWDELTDPQVRAAKAKYDAALEKARKDYEAKLVEAKKLLLSEL